MPDPNMRAKVENILYRWHADTKFESSSTKQRENPYYQMLIELGEEAIPFLVAEMDGHLDHALRAITGENPVEEHVAGDMDAIASYWADWLKQKNTRKKYPEQRSVLGVSLEPFEFRNRNQDVVVWMGDNDILDITVEHSSYFGRRNHEYLEVRINISQPDEPDRLFGVHVNSWESIEEEIQSALDYEEKLYTDQLNLATSNLSKVQSNRKLFKESLK